MRALMALGLTVAVGIAAGGCSMSGGGVTPVSASVPPAPPAPPPVVYGAFLEGPIGMKLSQADRDKALATAQEALAKGQRRSWKGERGTFGYVEPAASPTGGATAVPADADAAPAAPAEVCKTFTSTVFLGGHPQVGHGTGCQNPDGSYRITS